MTCASAGASAGKRPSLASVAADNAASTEDSAVSPVGDADENEEGARGFVRTHLRCT